MVVGTQPLADIGMDVPYGREVIIPAEKAARSRDLYKAISQKQIFQLPAQPGPQHVAPLGHVKDDLLQERNQFLEQRCKHLDEENKQLREALRTAMGSRNGSTRSSRPSRTSSSPTPSS